MRGNGVGTTSHQSDTITRLQDDVYQISGLRHGIDNYFELENRAEYIEKQFLSCRLPVKSQHFQYKDKIYRNVIATVAGEDASLPPLLIGAHYDGNRMTVGADDNASGTAVLLELARAFKNLAPPRTVELVAFTLEEPQTITHRIRRGSRYFAANARRAGTLYHGAVILECVGYTAKRQRGARLTRLYRIDLPREGNFLGVVANEPSRTLMNEFLSAANLAVPELPVVGYAAPVQGYLFPHVRLSDHSSFWEQDYPAIMLNDTVMFRNPHYHKVTDKPKTLDYRFMEAVTRAVLAFAMVK